MPTETMSHHAMVRRWRAGQAVPVAPRITDYAWCDGVWWRRIRAAWEAIPDGPFALALSAGRARIHELTGGTDTLGRSDPWTAERNRLRMGRSCRRLS
ncbi:MAG TPA: hypothetical protein VGJ28_21760 [Micromonosporaceae bacterium]